MLHFYERLCNQITQNNFFKASFTSCFLSTPSNTSELQEKIQTQLQTSNFLRNLLQVMWIDKPTDSAFIIVVKNHWKLDTLFKQKSLLNLKISFNTKQEAT